MKSALLFAIVAVLTSEAVTASAAKLRKYEHIHRPLHKRKQTYILFVKNTVYKGWNINRILYIALKLFFAVCRVLYIQVSTAERPRETRGVWGVTFTYILYDVG
jgi:hypothetical protein